MLRTKLVGVAGAASLALLSAAAPATAEAKGPKGGNAPVQILYHCVEAPYGEADAYFLLNLTAPRYAAYGSTVDVAATVTTTSPAPPGLLPYTLNGKIDVTAGGAGSGTVTATGLTNPVVPPAGDPLTLSGATASFTANATGLWKFRPGAFETINARNEHLVCTPKTTTPVITKTYVY
ncbi:hypothetical protein ACWDR0_33510 [Streptomyces sp. NPDC003691]